jgi:nitroreductase
MSDDPAGTGVPSVPAALGLSPRDVAAVLETAGLAPSVHNTQPWAFRVASDVIELHAEPARRLPVADPQDDELRIACGAALLNLRLALEARGVRPEVARLPDRDRPGLVAVIRHGGSVEPTPQVRDLLAAVPRRRTNRHPFSDVPVAVPEQQQLCRAAATEGAALHPVQDPARRTALGELSRRGHRAQMADPAFRAELAAWTGTPADRADGVPVAAGTRPAAADRWVLRDFTAGAGPERPAGKDVEDEPLIAVLTANLSGPPGDVQAGEALQRVLLTATVEGLAVSYLSQLVEVPEVRAAVHRLLGTARPPQVVLRIGHGWPTPRVPRRAVHDMLLGAG